jgi:Cu/Ag efflux protein CusF
MKNLLILISAFAFAACQQSAPINQTAKPKATVLANASPNNSVTATASPSVSAPDKNKIRNFDGTGTVTKINLEAVSVELDHEEIKGLMPKMIMEFYVKEKSELEKLKVGDRVNFVLEDDDGREQIISIKKSK